MTATFDLQEDIFQADVTQPARLDQAMPTALIDRVTSETCDSGRVEWDDRRWLTRSLPFDIPEDQLPLSLHADWVGPIRLVWSGDRWQRLCEIPFSWAAFGNSWLDPQLRDEATSLLDALIAGPLSGNVDPTLDACIPPEAETVAGWLGALGYQAAVDEDKNLRLTLKCRGCDGQVKILRADHRLRLSMRLGQWNGLSSTAEQAMIRLAREANTHGRFVRIAWSNTDGQSTCEAQVDLSGLPTGVSRDVFWQGVVRAAVLGLELALRRLGLELGVLANPKNQGLAKRLITRSAGRRRAPR